MLHDMVVVAVAGGLSLALEQAVILPREVANVVLVMLLKWLLLLQWVLVYWLLQ